MQPVAIDGTMKSQYYITMYEVNLLLMVPTLENTN
jgi:hypothetical protein